HVIHDLFVAWPDIGQCLQTLNGCTYGRCAFIAPPLPFLAHLIEPAPHSIFNRARLALPSELSEPAHHLVHAFVLDVKAHGTHCPAFLPSPPPFYPRHPTSHAGAGARHPPAFSVMLLRP